MLLRRSLAFQLVCILLVARPGDASAQDAPARPSSPIERLSERDVLHALAHAAEPTPPAPYRLKFPDPRPGYIGRVLTPAVRLAAWARTQPAEAIEPARVPGHLLHDIVLFEIDVLKMPEAAGVARCGDSVSARQS